MATLSSYAWEDKDFKIKVDINFKTKVNLTPRIIEVSESFGLGVSEEKHFTVYDDFRIGFNKGDVIYITGDSGGGKSLLLKTVQERLKDYSSISLEEIDPDPDEQVVESIGVDLEDAIHKLSLMGLNDAFIFLRKFKELSDGQKYRFRLAKILDKEPEFIFIDEFCANLDRTTAKVISYNLQRVCRKKNIGLFVATTHRDLEEDLNASVFVEKRFMDEVVLKYEKAEKKPISFYDDVVFEEGTIRDYKLLSKYHYKNTSSNIPYNKIVRARHGRDLVGVVLFSPPLLQTKGRTIKFDRKYSLMSKENVREINKLFIRGSRYILSPKYRGCGLGQKLVLESLPFIKNHKYLEVITVMGKYNPVFEKAGMEKIEITEETDPPTLRLISWMKEKSLRLEEVHNPKYFKTWVDSLSEEDKNTLKLMVGKVLHHPKIGLSNKDGRRAEVVAQEKRYKTVNFSEVYEEIISYVPKLFSGMTLYYILENPHHVERKQNSVFDYE